MNPLITALLGLIAGVVLGIAINRFVVSGKTTQAREAAERMLADAQKQAETTRKELLLEAKDEIFHREGSGRGGG